jgi:anaerobic magnesium-protoporphyrin IX monomethyl ester cyclase
MIDCLITGFYDYDLEKYVEMLKTYGADSGAFKDLDLAIIKIGGKHYRALDVLSKFHYRGEPNGSKGHRPFHNADFLWPTISYLGSYLAKRGFSFDYVNLFHYERERLREKLKRDKVLSVAITTTLYVIPQPILEIIEFIRSVDQSITIIVGGPYITNQMVDQDAAAIQRLFKLVGADVYVDSTEGEYALTQIITALKSNRSLKGIDNIAYRNNGVYEIGSKSTEANSLEENPVNYSLFPKEDLGEFVSLRTAKSCPFACAFCGFPQRAGKYKYVAVGTVEKELDALRDLGTVSTLSFLDDTFNVPKERFKELLRMMIRNKYGFKWNSFFRSDHGDEEAIALMGEAGCEGVFLGVESGTDTMLQKMNKTARTKDYRRAVPLLKGAGIFTHANLVVGFPGETLETFRETFRFIEEVQPDTFRAQLWYADPVTPVWRKKEELGIKGAGFNWSHNTMDCQKACALVDQMFLAIQNSVWLPQFGFELWSVYYLQRRGMTRDQIKRFLKCFNAIIREKLVKPAKDEINPTLLTNLEKSCRFDDAQNSTLEQEELYSASEYCASEKFWVDKCRLAQSSSPMFAQANSPYELPGSKYLKLAADAIARLQLNTDVDLQWIILAAFATALSRTKLRQNFWILVDSESATIPVSLGLQDNEAFAETIQRTAQELTEASRHTPYALRVFTSRYCMAEPGFHPPLLECGFNVSRLGAGDAIQSSPGSHQAFSEIRKGLKLNLEVVEAGREVRARILYDKACVSRTEVDDLSRTLNSILCEQFHASNPSKPSQGDGGSRIAEQPVVAGSF